MKSFKLFLEEEENKEKYVDTMKKQFGIQKRLWIGMPVLYTKTELGKKTVSGPTMFTVTDFDDNSVTISNVLNYTTKDQENYPDSDGEINTDIKSFIKKEKVILSKKDFFDLCAPVVPPQPQGMI